MRALIVYNVELRRLIVALLASAAVILAAFSAAAMLKGARSLTWRWDAGPSSGSVAPAFLGSSWDGVERKVIATHSTNNPEIAPYAPWRVTTDLEDIEGDSLVEFWVTQPSQSIIDPTTDAPWSDADGVDLFVRVESGRKVLYEQLITLDPPVAPEQRIWHRVIVNPPPGAERLSVIAIDKNMAYDWVWITEATIHQIQQPFGIWITPAALIIIAITLVVLQRLPIVLHFAERVNVALSKWGWLLVGISCSWLGYMLVWERGFYADDWNQGDSFIRSSNT